MHQSAYSDKAVFVTGGASFIGSHLCEALVRLGARVTVVDDLSSGKLANLEAIASEITFHHHDLRSASATATLLSHQDIVFHLAAIHGGRGFVDTLGVMCLANLRIDNILLDAVVECGVEKVVFASSACVYPTQLQVESRPEYLLREHDAGFARLGDAFPDGIYGWTKLMGELQLRSYHEAHKFSGVACRLFSVYGPRQTSSHSVAAVIGRALTHEEPFEIWGSGRQSRNFTHVSDAVTGLLRAGLLDGYAVVNVGLEQAVTLDALASSIFDQVGWRPAVIAHNPDKPIGVFHRAADNGAARRLLDWTPSTQLEAGLSETVAWYERHGPLDLSDEALFRQG
jgi:UDP-glucose 4-epimerase